MPHISSRKESLEKLESLKQRWLIVVVISAGLMGSFILFGVLRKNAWDNFQSIFKQRAFIQAYSVAQELERQLDRLEGVRRFMDARENVERKEFGQYVKPLLKGVSAHTLEWVPRITREERSFYEDRAHGEGFEAFQIFEKDADGKKVAALDRDVFFPVYYSEPLEGHEPALGFDLSTDPDWRVAMEKSRDIGQPLVTELFTVAQEGQSTGILVLLPVYAKGQSSDNVEQRRAGLKGFIVASYSADSFLKSVYSQVPPEGLSCLIEDLAAPPANRELYRHAIRPGHVNWKRPLLKYEMQLPMPGRQWRMTIVPAATFIERNLSRTYLWILPFGSLLTVLLAVFLNFLATARYRAESLVYLRTQELSDQKEELQKNREESRLILDSTAEAIYGIDLQGVCVFCNSACLRMLGYADPSALIGKNMHRQCHHSYENGSDFPVDSCRIFRVLKEGVGAHVDDEFFWKSDRKKFPVEYWAYPQWREGKVVGAVVTFVDITERKQTDDILRKREAYLTSIIDNFPYLVWLKDFDGRFLAVNDAFAKACGRIVEDIVGKTDFDVWSRELAEKYCLDDVKVIRGRLKTVVEESIIINDVTSYIETYKSPIVDREGRVIGTTGFAHDVTERKRAEKTIQESEARYRQIASAITDYIFTVFIEEGRPVRTNYNSACLAVTGYSADEFRANPVLWITIVIEEDRALIAKQIGEILSGKKDVEPVEHRIIHKNGTGRWIRNTVVLHHDAQGCLVSYDGLISDITARREAEKVLEDQKRVLDEHAIVSKTDAAGRITYVNDKFCVIVKYSREELIGQDHRIVNAGYHPKSFFTNLWRTIKSGNVWQGNIRNRAKDGTFYWLQSTIVPFMDERGRVKEYISARTDITQNMENEERLERAMQVKSNFISTVSHELRTPLASIKSSIDILNTEVPGKLADDQKVFLGRVKSNIDRLARLINDVLDLSKLESGKMTIHYVPIRPEEVVKEVVEMHRGVIRNKEIELDMVFEKELPLLLADKDRLTQVLNNLINNALKFTSQGKVSIVVSCEGQGMMRFSISDTGAGISEEDLPKLFQKFQQVGGVSQQVSGTGLGLAICKEIVEKHGGRIWVESQLGKGSAFIFTIPMKQQRSILVVDDEPGTLLTIRTILEGVGQYKVELASDGFMAGQKYLGLDPPLIILDIGLPKLSGLEVCGRIKRDPKKKHTRIIMMSSFTDDMEKKALEAGADDILKKPIDSKELIVKVDRLMSLCISAVKE